MASPIPSPPPPTAAPANAAWKLALTTKSSDWLEIERQLEQKEIELMKKEGIAMPEGHLEGYKYTPEPRVVQKQSWDVAATPNHVPKCNSGYWTHKDVKFEVGEGIAYITLSSPATNNALSESVIEGLHDACCECHRRVGDIRIVVLRADGRMFCAGGDPKSFTAAAAMSNRESKKSSVNFMRLLYYFQCLPQFTIGLAQGSAMGTGVGLLACCDVVCAVTAARFTVSEVKLGTCPGTIAPFIANKVGPGHAKRILLMCENLTAAAAMQMGLITEVVEDEMDFEKYVEGICDQVTNCAPIACMRSKKLVQNVARQPLSLDLFKYTGGQLADIRLGDEAVKGMVAVQAKTPPYWATSKIKPLY